MLGAVTITPGLPMEANVAAMAETRRAMRVRALVASAAIGLAFITVGGQLVRLAMRGQFEITSAISEPVAKSFARPEIVDRKGRLIATDVEVPSLFADPALIVDRDEVAEKLASVFPDLDMAELRRNLADRDRRFVWIRRGLPPKVAQQVHDLGLPGIAFRNELRRVYPAGSLAGHVLGAVNIDNKGVAGLERYIDEAVGVEPVQGASLTDRAPVRLSLDLGVQHTLEDELKRAMDRYRAPGAAGLVLDAKSGEIVASSSLPGVDPARSAMAQEPTQLDKIAGGTFELGSVFKMVTIAMALESGQATPDRALDVRQPLIAGPHIIRDLHPAGRPLSVAEVFIHSSNVGAGMLALEAGAERQQEFLKRLGLTEGMRTEAGAVAAPQLPARWEKAETITISYGHGLAVAPIQFAAAAAVLVNGGRLIKPTYLRRAADEGAGAQVLSPRTSAQIRDLMRRNVTDPSGTGRRADVPGYHVGGKTGTAELAVRGGYKDTAVISSFLAAFPIEEPRYVVLVMLFEPEGTAETKGKLTAGLNAAPTVASLISRIAPQLDLLPVDTAAKPASGG